MPPQPQPIAPRTEPFTTAEAAVELGFSAETIRKYRADLGGYRLGGKGPWRFPAEQIAFFKAHPKFITQPKAALQELFRTVSTVNLLSTQRERRMEQALAKFEKRLADLESTAVLTKAA